MRNSSINLRTAISTLAMAGALATFAAQPAMAGAAKNLKCSGCVNSKDIKDNGIKSQDIADLAVSTADLADSAVNSQKIADGTVGTADLAPDAVTSDKVQDDSLTAADLGPNSVANSELATGAVNSAKVLDNSLTAADLATNSVASSEVADNSLTQSDLATNSVASSEVLDNSLTQSDLATNSVASLEVQDSSLSGADIATRSVPSTDLVEPAGAEFAATASQATIASVSSSTPTLVKSISVTAPSTGVVILNASGWGFFSGSVSGAFMYCDLKNTTGAINFNNVGLVQNNTAGNTAFRDAFSITAGFIQSAGTVIYSMRCYKGSASYSATTGSAQITAIFVPERF